MSEQRRRGPMGGRGRMMSGEKAKDFKGSMAKLFRYMGRYKFRFILMFIFAVAGTVFSIVGPCAPFSSTVVGAHPCGLEPRTWGRARRYDGGHDYSRAR